MVQHTVASQGPSGAQLADLPLRASLWILDESLLEEDFGSLPEEDFGSLVAEDLDLEEVRGCDMSAVLGVQAMEQPGQKFVYARVGGVTTSAERVLPRRQWVRAIRTTRACESKTGQMSCQEQAAVEDVGWF